MVALSVDDGISLVDDILEDGDHLVLRIEHPGVRAEVVLFPLGCDLLIGNETFHHTLMADTGQRGIEVDKVAADMVHIAWQRVCAGEGTVDDLLTQRLIEGKLIAVLLPARYSLLPSALLGVLTIRGHHTIESEARRLLADLYLRIALNQFLTERRHTKHTTTRQRRDGQHVTTLLKHLREVVIHRPCDTLMLLPTKVGEFAHTRLQFILGSHKLLEESLTLLRQLSAIMGRCQQVSQLLIEHGVPVVARTMTTIMADVERLVATGGLRQPNGSELVRIVRTVCFAGVCLQFVKGSASLCPCCQSQQQEHDNG